MNQIDIIRTKKEFSLMSKKNASCEEKNPGTRRYAKNVIRDNFDIFKSIMQTKQSPDTI